MSYRSFNDFSLSNLEVSGWYMTNLRRFPIVKHSNWGWFKYDTCMKLLVTRIRETCKRKSNRNTWKFATFIHRFFDIRWECLMDSVKQAAQTSTVNIRATHHLRNIIATLPFALDAEVMNCEFHWWKLNESCKITTGWRTKEAKRKNMRLISFLIPLTLSLRTPLCGKFTTDNGVVHERLRIK